MTRAMTVSRGSATGNEFLLFSDADGAFELSNEQCASLANTLGGVDGVIRAVRSSNHPVARELLDTDPDAEWFMDHRNRDGSVAAVCGNALRVFVAFLMLENLVALTHGDRIAIATIDGVRDVQVGSNGTFRVDLGRWKFGGAPTDSKTATFVVNGVSNGLDEITIEPSDPLVDDGIGRIGIRLNDNASATPSWATSAVAAALATRHHEGTRAPHNWRVDMPGGSLGVQMFPTEDGEHVSISGSAEILPLGEFEI